MSVTEEELAHWLTIGQAAMETARYEDAARAFQVAHAALPTTPTLASMTGHAWRLAGRTLDARRAYQAAARHTAPSDIPTLYELGGLLLELGAPFEARACFDQVRSARPQDPAVWSALASATRACGDPFAAWPLVERALTARPSDPTFLLTAGQIRHALGDLEGAAHWLARAAAERPGHAPTEVQRAFTVLLSGAADDGWARFESRRRPAALPGTREWHGEPLDGAPILVVAEQGLGDQFHFVRYLPRLRTRGASRVVLVCPSPAVGLFRRSGIDAVPHGAALPPAAWSVPLLSLPHRLRVGVDVAAESIPYLHASPTPAASTPASDRPRRLGVVWQGNPEFGATVLRDLDDAMLQTLTAFNAVDWISLQFGVPIPPSCAANIAPMPPVRDWADTADLLATLDGVVTVDTSVAHLAGAMGLPAWVLLPFSPDWRWGLGTDTTAWYPSLRLVRQPTPCDWRGAIARLHAMLGTNAPNRQALP